MPMISRRRNLEESGEEGEKLGRIGGAEDEQGRDSKGKISTRSGMPFAVIIAINGSERMPIRNRFTLALIFGLVMIVAIQAQYFSSFHPLARQTSFTDNEELLITFPTKSPSALLVHQSTDIVYSSSSPNAFGIMPPLHSESRDHPDYGGLRLFGSPQHSSSSFERVIDVRGDRATYEMQRAFFLSENDSDYHRWDGEDDADTDSTCTPPSFQKLYLSNCNTFHELDYGRPYDSNMKAQQDSLVRIIR
jgi:hypothetical protein